jgi:putative ABC transport system permease protein
MLTLWQDLRFGARILWKKPGFTVVAVITLALGIGANTAIFSVVNAVLLRPLPFAAPEQLVMVWEDASFIGFPEDTPAPANYVDWQAQNHVFAEMAALEYRNYDLTGDGEPEKVQACGVPANFFAMLGVKAQLGRTFLPPEDQPGAGQVVVLSHLLWQSRFGGDSGVIGKEILLNQQKQRVVGVMPAGFQFLSPEIRLWTPLAIAPGRLADRDNHYLNVVARLKPGVSATQADTEIKAITANIARTYPKEADKLSAVVKPLRKQMTGDVSPWLLILLAAVGLVLLIACSNIANLLLARAAARGKEMAVRAALGAGRLRIVRQLLTESLMLGGLGGLLGIFFALWSFEFLQQLIPPAMTASTVLKLDAEALGFTLIVALLTGVIFGLAPAWQAAKIDLTAALKQDGGRSGLGAGHRRLRSALVVGEVALAFVLLMGAGLLIQTLFKLQNQYAVLQPEQALRLRTILPDTKAQDHAHSTSFYDQVLGRVQHLPGVVSAGYTTALPLTWKGGANGLTLESHPSDANFKPDANHRQISDDYFRAMGIPLRAGRYFNAQDSEQAAPVAIINETMARAFWPNENALGKRFKLGSGADSPHPYRTVVGIVADVRQMGVDEPVKAEMYFPYRQISTHWFFGPRDLVVRTSAEPTNLIAAVRAAIRAVDPNQPVSNVDTLAEVLGGEMKARRLGITLLTAFAALALLLAALGIYGVLSYFVAQHTREFGVRLALGAQPRDLLELVIGNSMKLTLTGVVLGVLGALALTRALHSLLFGVSAADPLTFALVALLLMFVALLACYIPARRATKVDPMMALRFE